MPAQEYPFVRVTTGQTSRAVPFLPIRLTNPDTGLSLQCYGLLDTGADSCVIPASVALYLGHDLRGEGVVSSVCAGVSGRQMPTYRHTFVIELLNSAATRPVWKSEPSLVDCVQNEIPIVLGVEEFLRHFRVVID